MDTIPLDVIPLFLHKWGYTKNMVYDCKVDTRGEFLVLQDRLMMLYFFIRLYCP